MGILTINFTSPTPIPANGFIVNYREIGASNYIRVYPNPMGSPAVITGVDNTKAYEGTIECSCTQVFDGPLVDFNTGTSYPLNPFDYLVIRYKNNSGGDDLNSFTGLVNTGTSYDINYGSNTNWVGDSEPSSSPYLVWAGNNTTNGGEEAVMVNFKQFIQDHSSPLPNIVTIRLHAWWYNTLINGNTIIEFQTWLGGTPPVLDIPIKDFDKVDGNQVDFLDIPKVVSCNRGSLSVSINCAQQIMELVYNTETKTGYIIPISGGCVCLSAATVNVSVTQQIGPYVDNEIQVKDNGVDVLDVYGTGTGSVSIPVGDTLSIEQYASFYSTGMSPMATLTVFKNGTNVYSTSMVCEPGTSLIYTDTVSSGDVYDVTSVGTATGDTGYVVINKTGNTMTYNVRPVMGGSITSSGTLTDGQFADLLGILTGGSSSYIDFDAPITSTYTLHFQPSATTSSLGTISSGNIILGMTASSVSTNQGLGYNSTVITT